MRKVIHTVDDLHEAYQQAATAPIEIQIDRPTKLAQKPAKPTPEKSMGEKIDELVSPIIRAFKPKVNPLLAIGAEIIATDPSAGLTRDEMRTAANLESSWLAIQNAINVDWVRDRAKAKYHTQLKQQRVAAAEGRLAETEVEAWQKLEQDFETRLEAAKQAREDLRKACGEFCAPLRSKFIDVAKRYAVQLESNEIAELERLGLQGLPSPKLVAVREMIARLEIQSRLECFGPPSYMLPHIDFSNIKPKTNG